jgi:hypothetical protein
MNDNYRLLKLLSLVAWTYENRCGLKYQSEVDKAHFGEDTAAALNNVCGLYPDAVKHYRDGSHVLDAQQLPEYTLEAVTTLSSDVIDVLGGMVKESLGVLGRADAAALGRLWLEDVTATAWRLVLANKAELWGTDVDGVYAQYLDRPPHTP